MKNTTLADMPKHHCPKPGTPSLGFAPLDFDVMKAMIDRNASKEEINRQVRAWITDDASRNPTPTEPDFEKFKAAMLTNAPFAIYCSACLETICLIHPEQVEEIANSHEHDLPPTTDEVTGSRVQELRTELEQLGRLGVTTWADQDISEALNERGIDPSADNIRAVRDHPFVLHIDDEMTATGWRVIEEARRDTKPANCLQLLRDQDAHNR